MGVLQKVVFELQGEVVDLKFHIELLDHCISLLMAMKSYSNQQRLVHDLLDLDAILRQ